MLGFNAASAGVMVRSFNTFCMQHLSSWPKMMLILSSACIFYIYQSVGAILFCMVFSGVISLYLEVDEVRKRMSFKSEDLFKNLTRNVLFGKNSIILLFAILFLMWIYFSIYIHSPYSYAFTFYLIGCLIIGPIESIFAYALAFLPFFGHLDPAQIWIAIPFSLLLPGTHMNIIFYYGALIGGIKGAMITAIFLNIPCILSLFGLLPEWKYYRDREGVRHLYEGLICSTTGFLLAIVLKI
jgi:hypothetical protein